MSEEYIYIMSFDIGIRNQACHIDRYKWSDLQKLKCKNIPSYQRYTNNKECTENFNKFLNELYKLGERVFTDKIDLAEKGDKKIKNRFIVTNKILVKLTNYLEDLNQNKIFDKVNYFLIEQQVKKNNIAQQISYHVRAYLIMLFLQFKPIIMFPSKYKTQILGAPKFIKTNDDKSIKLGAKRKKWASELALKILTQRNDTQGIKDLFTDKKYGKPDDCSDVLLMCVAFCYMAFIDDNKFILQC